MVYTFGVSIPSFLGGIGGGRSGTPALPGDPTIDPRHRRPAPSVPRSRRDRTMNSRGWSQRRNPRSPPRPHPTPDRGRTIPPTPGAIGPDTRHGLSCRSDPSPPAGAKEMRRAVMPRLAAKNHKVAGARCALLSLKSDKTVDPPHRRWYVKALTDFRRATGYTGTHRAMILGADANGR